MNQIPNTKEKHPNDKAYSMGYQDGRASVNQIPNIECKYCRGHDCPECDGLPNIEEAHNTRELKFKVDDVVFCNGLVAKVESISTIAGTDRPLYSLVSVEDPELSCSVGESEIEKYNGEEIDQSEALNTAHFESFLIAKTVDNVTDKYYGDT